MKTAVEQIHDDTFADKDKIKLILRYPTFLLKVCGSYVELGKDRRCGCRQNFHLLYSIFLSIFLWADNVRYLLAIFHESRIERLMSMAVPLIYNLVKSFYITYCLSVLTRTMPDIYEKFRSYQQNYGLSVSFKIWQRNLRILTTCLVVHYISVVTGSIIVYNLRILSKDSILHKMIYPFDMLHEGRLVMLGALIVIAKMLIVSMFHNSFYLFQFLVCQILKLEYRKFTKKLKTTLEKTKETESVADDRTEIESCRRHHYAITELVTSVNDVIQHMAGMQYGISLTVLCVILYGLAYGQLVLEDMIILSSNVIIYFFSMVHLTFTAAALNKEAHSPYDILYQVDTGDLPVRTVLQIQMFLSRLKGPPIGINLYGLFTIDGTTILMLFGTLLTYGIIVLQMAPQQLNDTTKPCHEFNNSFTLS